MRLNWFVSEIIARSFSSKGFKDLIEKGEQATLHGNIASCVIHHYSSNTIFPTFTKIDVHNRRDIHSMELKVSSDCSGAADCLSINSIFLERPVLFGSSRFFFWTKSLRVFRSGIGK